MMKTTSSLKLLRQSPSSLFRRCGGGYTTYSSQQTNVSNNCQQQQQQPLLGSTRLLSMTARRFIGAGKNPYQILGVKEGADKKEIKKAYRVLARKHHPDAPGGNSEKFQEISAAYEAVKNGVWVKKGDDSGEPGSSGNTNRYANFRYTTRKHKNKVSYDDFYAEMHGSGKGGMDFDEDEMDPEGAKKRKANPTGANSPAFQAWFRLIMLWSVMFCFFRIALFATFPPKYHSVEKKKMPAKPRKPPPPRALPNTPALA